MGRVVCQPSTVVRQVLNVSKDGDSTICLGKFLLVAFSFHSDSQILDLSRIEVSITEVYQAM